MLIEPQVRNKAILSNRLAYSRDIATAFARQEWLFALACGPDPEMQVGPGTAAYLRSPRVQSQHLGIGSQTQEASDAFLRPARQKEPFIPRGFEYRHHAVTQRPLPDELTRLLNIAPAFKGTHFTSLHHNNKLLRGCSEPWSESVSIRPPSLAGLVVHSEQGFSIAALRDGYIVPGHGTWIRVHTAAMSRNLFDGSHIEVLFTGEIRWLPIEKVKSNCWLIHHCFQETPCSDMLASELRNEFDGLTLRSKIDGLECPTPDDYVVTAHRSSHHRFLVNNFRPDTLAWSIAQTIQKPDTPLLQIDGNLIDPAPTDKTREGVTRARDLVAAAAAASTDTKLVFLGQDEDEPVVQQAPPQGPDLSGGETYEAAQQILDEVD